MIFAVNFDGTIVEHKYPEIGNLKENVKETMNKIRNSSHKIIIWTCRHKKEDLSAMIRFLDSSKIPYDKINENISDIGFVPFPKIYADIYIDDRNMFCREVNWYRIELYLQTRGIIL